MVKDRPLGEATCRGECLRGATSYSPVTSHCSPRCHSALQLKWCFILVSQCLYSHAWEGIPANMAATLMDRLIASVRIRKSRARRDTLGYVPVMIVRWRIFTWEMTFLTEASCIPSETWIYLKLLRVTPWLWKHRKPAPEVWVRDVPNKSNYFLPRIPGIIIHVQFLIEWNLIKSRVEALMELCVLFLDAEFVNLTQTQIQTNVNRNLWSILNE